MDHVFEAYQGTWGAGRVQRETRERMDWLLAQIHGDRVLDIGCSQGLLALLLAECRPVEVLGVDVLDKAIVFAKKMVAEKTAILRGEVTFKCQDFMTLAPPESNDERFDSVVIGQVLEHLVDPRGFVAHAAKFVRSGGRLIVTVPYGLWEHDEHDQTFYARDLLHTLDGILPVTKLEMAGGRLAAVMEPDAESTMSIAEVNDLEYEFFLDKERRYLRAIEDRGAVLENVLRRAATAVPRRALRLAMRKFPFRVLDFAHPATLQRFVADRRGDLNNLRPAYRRVERKLASGPTFHRAIAFRKALSLGSESLPVKKMRAKQKLLEDGFPFTAKSARLYIADTTSLLYVMNASLPYSSSDEAWRLQRTLEALNADGWTAAGVTPLGYPYDARGRPIGSISPSESVAGVTYHRLSANRIDDMPLDVYLGRYADELEALAKARKPFVLHALADYATGLVCAKVATALGIGFVYEVRDAGQLRSDAAQTDSASAQLRARLQKQTMQRADHVLCDSAAKSFLIEAYDVDPRKAVTIPETGSISSGLIGAIYSALAGQTAG